MGNDQAAPIQNITEKFTFERIDMGLAFPQRLTRGLRRYAAVLGMSCLLIATASARAADNSPANGATSDSATSEGRAQKHVEYLRDVKPLLRERCFPCHGALSQESDLRLDTVVTMREGGFSGPAVVPGYPAASPIIERITASEDSERMPPEGRPLTEEEIAVIRAWIEQGALAPADEQPEADPSAHWAFLTPRRPPLPTLDASLIATPPAAATTAEPTSSQPERDSGQLDTLDTDFRTSSDTSYSTGSIHPIDAFLEAEIRRYGLVANPPAEKSLLLRRVYLDLIGIPPTREELRRFLADEAPDAYDRVVDRLLESPQHGERWGRHWMDIWRYSDWYGRRMVPDVWNSAPQIWRWRDWIVRSLNDDKGYDQMVREMLAADEVAPEDPAAAVATGYLIRNWYALNPNDWMRSNVEHTAKAFLGLTFNCAHCHDHKYDPIKQDDYFRLRAFLEPIGIRQDRVAGEPDPGPFQEYEYGKLRKIVRTGSVQIFDQNPELPTWFYRAGDERNRVTQRGSIAPEFPEFLGDFSIKVEPVELAATTWYPGLREDIRRDILQEQQEREAASETELEATRNLVEPMLPALREQLAAAQSALAQGIKEAEGNGLVEQVELAQRALDLEELKWRAAKANYAAAVAQTESVVTRLNADARRYLSPAARQGTDAIGPGQVEEIVEGSDRTNSDGPMAELIRRASRAEREAAVAAAHAAVLRQELRLAVAQAQPAAEANRAVEIEAAATALATAREGAEKARAERADSERDSKYSPFGPQYARSSTGRRAALARWLTHPDHPLTARVAINHIWLRHFHSPLVADVADFGRNGALPTHPELLDWLAVELIESGWSMKRIHRLMVTSQAYQRSSRSHHENTTSATSLNDERRVSITRGTMVSPSFDLDPENRYLWRMNPGRMEAEVLRDSLLSTAGTLDLTMGGQELENSEALTSYRRTIYFSCHPELDGKSQFGSLFDAPDAVECYRRTQSVVPQQALALTNSELIHKLSFQVADLLWAELSDVQRKEIRQFVKSAHERILCRCPTDNEMAICLDYLDTPADSGSGQAPAVKEDGQSNVSTHESTSRENDFQARRRASMIRALLNHNDFVTIR